LRGLAPRICIDFAFGYASVGYPFRGNAQLDVRWMTSATDSAPDALDGGPQR